MNDIWTLVNKTNELGSMEAALEVLKPSRQQCDVVNRQRRTVYEKTREAIEGCKFGQELSQGTTVQSKDHEPLKVSLGSDDHFDEFLNWFPSQGEEVYRQIVADPESMLPGSGNWSLFEKSYSHSWYPKTGEGNYFSPLEKYYLDNFIRPTDPNSEVCDIPHTVGKFFVVYGITESGTWTVVMVTENKSLAIMTASETLTYQRDIVKCRIFTYEEDVFYDKVSSKDDLSQYVEEVDMSQEVIEEEYLDSRIVWIVYSLHNDMPLIHAVGSHEDAFPDGDDDLYKEWCTTEVPFSL